MKLSEFEFEELVSEADRSLEDENKPIHARPLNAVIKILNKFHVSGPLVDPRNKSIEFPVTNLNLSNHVHAWYERRYGDLLKIDPSPGRFPIFINGATYCCKLPMAVGSFTVLGKKGRFKSNNILNAVDFVENLPEHVRLKLDYDIEGLLQVMFITCLEVTKELRGKDSDLLSSAKPDILVSCDQLIGSNINPSLSAWHSLQFSEKVLKYFIGKHEEPEQIHKIKRLKNKAVKLGYFPDDKINWDVFDFNASVRYDPSAIPIKTAVAANHEAWRVGYNILMQL